MSAEMLDCPALGCKEEFVGTIARNLHVRREHPGMSPQPAPIEDPQFVDDAKAGAPAEYPCPDCGKTFPDPRRLGPHRNKAHGFRARTSSHKPRPTDADNSAPHADNSASPEEPKSEPAAEPTDDRPARQPSRPTTARRGSRKAPKARKSRKPPASRDEVVVKMALDAGDKMAAAARRFLRLYAEMMGSSVDSGEMENACWRLGAAVADYEDSRP